MSFSGKHWTIREGHVQIFDKEATYQNGAWHHPPIGGKVPQGSASALYLAYLSEIETVDGYPVALDLRMSAGFALRLITEGEVGFAGFLAASATESPSDIRFSLPKRPNDIHIVVVPNRAIRGDLGFYVPHHATIQVRVTRS